MLHRNEGWAPHGGRHRQRRAAKGRLRQDHAGGAAGRGVAGAGRRVAMLDIDPQASLFAWFNIRRRRFGEVENGLLVQGLSGWRLGGELRRLRPEYELIVVDSPAHAETDARAAIREADLALVPCQPNALDVWASAPTLELARPREPRADGANRVPPRGRAAEQMRARLRRSAGRSRSVLGNRQLRGLDRGGPRGRRDGARSAAGQEIAALADEVLARLA